MSEQIHRNNWVSPEAANSRYPSPLSAKQAKRARKLISNGKMTHQQAAEHFGCTLAELVAATERRRSKGQGHGNAVLNIDPMDRDEFRREHCRNGEAIRSAFKRHLVEARHYRAWAQAMGCPPFASELS